MIITKTPFRMSFFGGGTDMPEFFNEHGGSELLENKYLDRPLSQMKHDILKEMGVI